MHTLGKTDKERPQKRGRLRMLMAGLVALAPPCVVPVRYAWAMEALTVKHGFVLDGVNVVNTHNGQVAPNMAVAIDGGKIVRIVHAGTIKANGDVKVIKAHGKYVVPGFLDMHMHALDDAHPEDSLAVMLAYGITGVRQMSGSPRLLELRKAGKLMPAADAPELLAMPGQILTRANAATPEAAGAEVDRQKAEGADFIKTIDVTPEVFFVALEKAKSVGLPYAGHLSPGVDAAAASKAGMRAIEHLGPAEMEMISCSTAEDQIRDRARQAQAARPARPPMPPEAMANFAKLAIADPVLARVKADPGALLKTQHLIDTYSEEKCRALAKVFVANNTWQVPTLIRLQTMQQASDPQFTAAPELRFVPQDTRAYWTTISGQFAKEVAQPSATTLQGLLETELKMTRTFDASGVKMLTGSDYGGIWVIPGVSLHQEFDLLARAGLSPLTVLQMTSLNGAIFFGREATAGSVEEGKDANLVLLDGNPIESVGNLHKIDAVVRGGRLYTKEQLSSLKAEVAGRLAAQPASSAVPKSAAP